MRKQLTGLTILLLLLATGLNAATATINAGTTHQTIRGFGGSNAWSDCASCNGSAQNSWLVTNADKLFSTTTGIGLSMIRMRIPPDASQFGAAIAPVQAARDRGALVFATEWTPPPQWKSSNTTSNSNGEYLLPANYQNYANYLRDFVKTMKTTYNVDIYALCNSNEPDYKVSYDGCTWSGAQEQDFIKNYLGPTFAAAGLTTKIIAGESYANAFSITDPTLNDATAANYVSIAGVHTYGGGPSAYPLAVSKGKEYWMTEMADFGNWDAGMPGMGLKVAGWIHNGLVNSEYNAWVYWWLASDQKNEGLTGVNNGDAKRFYVMGNYSKFIRPGYIRIDATAAPASGITCSAYKSPTGSGYVIVATNSGSSASSMTFNLSGMNVTSVTPHITSSSLNLAAQAAVSVSGNSFTYSLPAQSVVSFVAAGTAGPTDTPTTVPTPVVKSTWRVNAGGEAYTDTLGNVWAADVNFTGGTVKTITNAITNTTDPTLYQSERYGSPVTYTFNVPAGSYQVTLKYAETYQTASGTRVFNVSINGTQVQTNFDIFADSGAQYKADDKVFNNIAASGGQITIQVGPASVDNAQICAIQIIPQPSITPTNTVPTTVATNTFTKTNTPVTGTPTFTPTIGTGTNKQYCFTLDYSAVPADIYKKMITLNVSVGTASSCNVTADGSPIICTYTASTGTCSFSLNSQKTNIVVTAVNWTSGGTGAATKATLWENKKWAYSFTFDDNYSADYTIVYPYFSARNLRAGVGVVTSWIGGGNYLNRTQLDALFNAGWGILNHSTTHPQSTISASNLATYIGAAKTTLESWYPTNYKSIYFIYPYLEMGYKAALSTSGYARGAEGVDGTNYVDTFPSDTFNLYRHGLYASVNASAANAWADAAASDSRPRWNIVFTHNTVAGSGTPGTYDTNQSTLESHINYVYTTYGDGGSTKNMWFAPSDEVLMYLYTRQNLVINNCSGTPSYTPTTPAVTNTFTQTNTATVPTNTPTFTPTIVVASTWRINVGGPSYADSLGNTWSADTNYNSGTARTVTDVISGTNDPVLYQTERYGSPFIYTFNVPAGSYQVTLKFAELYQTTAGSRVFNVSINGTQVLTNLDLFTDSGAAYKAVDKVLNNITAINGQITIQVGPASVDNAQVCAIQIIPMPATPTSTPTTPVPTNTFTNTPITPSPTPTTPVPTDTPITPSPTPTTPVPTDTPITPSPTPTTPVPTNTPITPSPTPTTPVPTNTPITPSPTPTTPVPTNTPITPSPTPTTPVPTDTPITPSPTPTTPVPTNTPITPSPTPTTPVPTNTPITPTAIPTTAVPTNTPITPTAIPTTPVPTNTPITPTAIPTTAVPTNTVVIPTAIPTSTTVPSLSFMLKSSDTNNNSSSPHPQFRVVNSGTSAANLNNMEVRYWFNCDCTGQVLQAFIDWAGKMPQGQTLGSNVQISVVASARGSQTNYLSIKFSGNITIQPNEFVEIQTRFNKSDWSSMPQSNDWSFSNSQSWLAYQKITGYSSGALIWGQEPPITINSVVVANVLTYPNPASAQAGATLQYTVNRVTSGLSAADMEPIYVPDPATKVYLQIFSVAGRLIWEQVLSGVYYVSTGEHRVSWDGKAAGGRELAAGTYTFKVLLKEPTGASQGYSRILMVK